MKLDTSLDCHLKGDLQLQISCIIMIISYPIDTSEFFICKPSTVLQFTIQIQKHLQEKIQKMTATCSLFFFFFLDSNI